MHSIIGRAVVVHGDPDDLGKGIIFLFSFFPFSLSLVLFTVATLLFLYNINTKIETEPNYISVLSQLLI